MPEKKTKNKKKLETCEKCKREVSSTLGGVCSSCFGY